MFSKLEALAMYFHVILTSTMNHINDVYRFNFHMWYESTFWPDRCGSDTYTVGEAIMRLALVHAIPPSKRSLFANMATLNSLISMCSTHSCNQKEHTYCQPVPEMFLTLQRPSAIRRHSYSSQSWFV